MVDFEVRHFDVYIIYYTELLCLSEVNDLVFAPILKSVGLGKKRCVAWYE